MTQLEDALRIRNWDGVCDHAVRFLLPEGLEDIFDVAKRAGELRLPKTDEAFEAAFLECTERASKYVDHYLGRSRWRDGFLVEDQSWKNWATGAERDRHYAAAGKWQRQSHALLLNTIVAVNKLGEHARRLHISSMIAQKQISFVDSMGVTNGLDGYSAIPTDYVPVE